MPDLMSRYPRPVDRANTTDTAFDDRPWLGRKLGLIAGSQDLTPQPRNSLDDPNAESAAHWRYTPGSPWEASQGAQRAEAILGAPGVNEMLFASNFLAPRPGAAMLPAPAPAPKPQGIRAYHGSPHDFAPEPGYPLGRFDQRKIGTGEGSTLEGRGHYFSEHEPHAKSYRDGLSETQGTAGKMYEVNLNLEPGRILDYTQLVSQQPPIVRDAIIKAFEDDNRLYGRSRLPQPHPGARRASLYVGGAEDRLKESGVQAVRYPASGSPGKSNYVVFDDKLIEILRKYGLAGLMAGGAASQAPGLLAPSAQSPNN